MNFFIAAFDFSVPDFACTPIRRGMLTLGNVFGDLFDSRQGRASSGGTDFGAISSDLGPKILRPRIFFENLRSEPRALSRQKLKSKILRLDPVVVKRPRNVLHGKKY